MLMEAKKKFEGLGTKIDPAMFEVLNACCDALGVNVYHLIQWFAYTLIKAAAPWHELDPRIQKILSMMESDAGWQQAFNIANPGKLKVAQAILILEQEGRKGFGAVMVDKPWMGDARQTECVDTILERTAEVTMPGMYRRLRLVGAKMECESLMDVLLTMIDAQTQLYNDECFRAELPGMGDRADNGRKIAYGKKTKAKQRRTPDSLANDQRIKFDDYDRETAIRETSRYQTEQSQSEEEEFGYRPFTHEW